MFRQVAASVSQRFLFLLKIFFIFLHLIYDLTKRSAMPLTISEACTPRADELLPSLAVAVAPRPKCTLHASMCGLEPANTAEMALKQHRWRRGRSSACGRRHQGGCISLSVAPLPMHWPYLLYQARKSAASQPGTSSLAPPPKTVAWGYLACALWRNCAAAAVSASTPSTPSS